jgi:hypothetical protein
LAFAQVPVTAADRTNTAAAVEQARSFGAMLLLTLEPRGGLDLVTDDVVADVAALLRDYNDDGVDVFVRFAHEMNGSWYPWSQDPDRYITAFRRLATAVHDRAPRSKMMWAPNYGGGYPFAGGQFESEPGTSAFQLLDTNHDGSLTQADDPYAPYFPGPEAVDWVGMSIYHWGNSYPWGENEVPEPGKFHDFLRGTYNGAAGDEEAVPDFYGEYAHDLDLPLAVTETAAMYVPGGGGADELAVKQPWWSQVLAPHNDERLPMLRMVNWFEWRKFEPEVGTTVDWTVTFSPQTLPAFQSALPTWLRFAGDVTRCP